MSGAIGAAAIALGVISILFRKRFSRDYRVFVRQRVQNTTAMKVLDAYSRVAAPLDIAVGVLLIVIGVLFVTGFW